MRGKRSSRFVGIIAAPMITLSVRPHGAEITGLCHLPLDEGPEYSSPVRLKKTDVKPIIADLEEHGIEAVS